MFTPQSQLFPANRVTKDTYAISSIDFSPDSWEVILQITLFSQVVHWQNFKDFLENFILFFQYFCVSNVKRSN